MLRNMEIVFNYMDKTMTKKIIKMIKDDKR